MYCPKCSSIIRDNEMVCPFCQTQIVPQPPVTPYSPFQQQQGFPPQGYQQQGYQQQQVYVQNQTNQQNGFPPIQPSINNFNQMYAGEKSTMATLALIFAFFIPIAGLVLGIIGVNKFQNPSNKSKCTAAIVVSIVVWVISTIASIVLQSLIYY